ncbi:hypothetical protein BH10ACT11_BH10ACT11_15500 [soil metagenome]
MAPFGDVLQGGPRASAMPRGPVSLATARRALRADKGVVERVIARRECDLVLTSSAHLPAATLAAREAGVAIAVYAGEPRSTGLRARLAARALARAVGRRADVVMVPSQRSAEWQAELGIAARVITPVIELADYGPDLADRARSLRDELGLGGEQRVIASLGSLNHARGQDVLIDAVSRGVGGGSDWALLIGGESLGYKADRRFEAKLRSTVRSRGLEDRISFCGAVSDPAAFLAAADVVVNPARVEESFGRVACEALLAGTPVVSSAPGAGQGFLAADRDLLVSPREDPPALLAAIVRLLDQPDVGRTMVASASAEVRRRCAPTAVQPEFDSAIAQALESAGARRGDGA